MNIEEVREYSLSLPHATEDMPFDDTTLVFRVAGKIFAALDLNRPEWVTMKCEPDYAIDLRDAHEEIQPAWHWNKKHWNQVNLEGHLPTNFVCSLIRHSYDEVIRKMPKKLRDTLLD